MSARFGWPAALFSLKCFAASMLALFVALSIGLEPYWAFLTSYISFNANNSVPSEFALPKCITSYCQDRLATCC